MNKKSLLPVFLIPSCLVLIPGAAMLFSVRGVAWSPADFVIMWVLIAATVFAYQLLASRANTTAYRVGAALGLFTGFALVWINGAVGLIGSENNPANTLYAGVLAIGAISASIARLHPAGMARALFVTAFAQFLVPVVALLIWRPDFGPGVVLVFVLNFVFVLMFATSGLLFRLAANKSDTTRLPSLA